MPGDAPVGAEVTVDGIVHAPDERAVFVEAKLHASGADDVVVHRRSKAIEVVTDEQRRIRVTFAANVGVRPEREESGPWRSIKQHPARPQADYHPEGHVRLRGAWIVPGDRVRVIGRVVEQEFVPDTGGEREAPEQRVSAIEAIAIGAGTFAPEDLVAARKLYESAAHPPPPKAPADPHVWRTRWMMLTGALATGLIALDLAREVGTLGIGLTVAFGALIMFWWASPELRAFPGGAETGRSFAPELALLSMPGALLVSLVGIAMSNTRLERNGWGAAGAVCVGLMLVLLSGMWTSALGRPRAAPGYQTMLPASKVRRWILRGCCVALIGIAASIAIDAMADNMAHRHVYGHHH